MNNDNIINLKVIGNRIKLQRKYKGYSREKLAEFVGISSRFVAYIENGEQEMGIKTAIKICEILDLTPQHLLYPKENWDADDMITLLNNCPPSKVEIIKGIIQLCLKF